MQIIRRQNSTSKTARSAIRFREPIVGRTGLHRVGASIGYAIGAAAEDFTRLAAAADAEMYREKRRAREPVS